MKTLILAEKPELGRAIAAAVNATERERQGVIQKGDLTITWAYGHLLRLKEPEEYDPKYKQWKMCIRDRGHAPQHIYLFAKMFKGQL